MDDTRDRASSLRQILSKPMLRWHSPEVESQDNEENREAHHAQYEHKSANNDRSKNKRDSKHVDLQSVCVALGY